VNTILLVEDNENNRDMLSRRLRKKGFEVAVAIDGIEAVEKAAQLLPDIILMDISLPGIDGLEATRRICTEETTRDIPIIALTAHAQKTDKHKALNAGCADYDTKPIDLKRLLVKINGLLKQRIVAQ
jgi:CheY-like chemotaxis protein